MTILIVYVDDIILTWDDVVELDRLKKALAHEFEIKHLGSQNTFLEWSMRDPRKVFLSLNESTYLIC